MQPLSGNQRPDLLTCLLDMSFVLRLPHEMHCDTSSRTSHACHRFWNCSKTHLFGSPLTNCNIHCAGHEKWQLNVQKWFVFPILTSKCASRHNAVHFFGISTVSVQHVWLRNVLRATATQFLNISTKCSEPAAFVTCRSTSKSAPTLVSFTCWLQNLLRATALGNSWSLS